MGQIRVGTLVACVLVASSATTAVAGPPPNDDCANAEAIAFPVTDHPWSNIGATTDGPPPSDGCTSGALANDVWLEFTLAATTTVFVNSCLESAIDSIVVVYSGGCGGLTELECQDDGVACTGGVSFLVPDLPAGTYLIRIGGFNGLTGTGTIDVTESVGCPGDGGDCCAANGTPGCDDIACCEAVCAADPFCCDVSWDGICQGAAIDTLCVDLCNAPPPSDCCIANDTPGCETPECEAIICAIDPFCCEAVWDGSCADMANAKCDVCSGGGGLCPVNAVGDCCDPAGNGSPGCDDPTCCEAVCADDPFCCDTAWDGICAGLAATLCEICTAPPCDVEAEAGDADEGEPCGDDTNGGCNSTPPVFGTCTGAIFGNAWADGGTRDTDWYQVEVASATTLTAELTSEFSGVTFIVDGIATCAPVVIGDTGDSNGCTPGAVASASVGAGTYVIFAANSAFEGSPCGTNNEYRLVTSCAGGPPPCTGDTNGDGEVNVSDLTNVIILWGTDGQQPGIDADTDDDGVVGVGDLTDVILNWGTCPG